MTFKPSTLIIGTLLALNLGGCSIVNHLDELSTMAEYSRDKNVQSTIVDNSNDNYKKLLEAINVGKLKDYPDQTAILHNFGEPVMKKTVVVNGQSQEQWLYRDPIPQKATTKVYLYFDAQGKLIDSKQEKIQW